MEVPFLCPSAVCSQGLPIVDLTSSMCSSSLPGSEVGSVPCWENINRQRWPWHPTSLALGLGRAVLRQSQTALGKEAAHPWGPFQPTCLPKREPMGTL